MTIVDATLLGALLAAALWLACDVALTLYQVARWVYKHTRRAR